MRRIISATIFLALILTPVQRAAAGNEPARSGTIVGGSGWFVEGQVGGCQLAPDCAAWVQSDCDPALTEREPAWMASIVDVAELADGRTRRIFEWGAGDPWGLMWGGTVVQFWQEDCTEMRGHRWRSTDCDGDATGRDCWSTTIRIPLYAKWMTVSSSPDNLNVSWTLSRSTPLGGRHR